MGKSKGKGTKIKKQNKVRTKMARQGKMKMIRHKKTIVKTVQPNPILEEEEQVESDHGEDLLTMVDKEDIDFLKESAINKKYSMFDDKSFAVKKKKKGDDDDPSLLIEEAYEKAAAEEEQCGKRTRLLLPIKTKEGLIRRAVTEDVVEEPEKGVRGKKGTEETNEGDESDKSDEFEFDLPDRDVERPVSVAEMLSWREQTLANYKFKIGILCSGLLEDPELKVQNITKLLKIYDEWHPELQVTLKKLVIVSLLEVFKDILPSYVIKHQDDPNVKLKKDTRRLQMFEKSLLKGYRGYLTRLEKLAAKLYKKKGDTRVVTEFDKSLGEISINCLCELLTIHLYANYSKNIVQMLTPYLDNPKLSVRNTVADAFRTVFSTDKKGEITLDIVRKINELVKKKKHSVKPEVILVLESLHLEEINLDDVKELQMKHKKALEKKKRLINLSKRERKRMKRLAEVEQELMETKGEENKQNRQALLTEVTKFVFTIYFRILKSAPSSGLLSAALQGLAKFAPCINIEFYLDLVRVLDALMKTGELKVQEQLNCALTVFIILSGQGEVLNIDPNNFYKHLYNNMLSVTAGENSKESLLLLQCLERVIVGRRKKLTEQRLLGFIKRLGTITLHQEHHVCLSSLAIIKQVLQLQKSTDILLDMDSSVGQGIYLPELEDPEHCNAASTSLYEISLLKRHYHPVVRQMAQHISYGVPATGEGTLNPDIAKLGPFELFSSYDSSEMIFNPPVSKNPAQRKTKLATPNQMCQIIMEKYLSEVTDIKLDGSAMEVG